MDSDARGKPERTIVPHERLSAAALEGLIDDFVTREGTDYGAVEHSLDSKRAAVRRQLERGEALVVFDHETESVTLVARSELRGSGRSNE